MQAERFYKVGYFKVGGGSVKRDNLLAMTHRQALTFRSKQIDPASYFLYEVGSDQPRLGVYKRKINREEDVFDQSEGE